MVLGTFTSPGVKLTYQTGERTTTTRKGATGVSHDWSVCVVSIRGF